MLKKSLKSRIIKYSLLVILCSSIYSSKFIISSSAKIAENNINNLNSIEISNNIDKQDIVTSENYDAALQKFIIENNYDYNLNTGLNILDEFMKEYNLDCLIRVSQ